MYTTSFFRFGYVRLRNSVLIVSSSEDLGSVFFFSFSRVMCILCLLICWMVGKNTEQNTGVYTPHPPSEIRVLIPLTHCRTGLYEWQVSLVDDLSQFNTLHVSQTARVALHSSGGHCHGHTDNSAYVAPKTPDTGEDQTVFPLSTAQSPSP